MIKSDKIPKTIKQNIQQPVYRKAKVFVTWICHCLAPFLHALGTLIKANALHLWSWKIPASEIDFWQILVEIERAAILRSIDTEVSNIQIRLQFMVAFRNWFLITKIVILGIVKTICRPFLFHPLLNVSQHKLVKAA